MPIVEINGIKLNYDDIGEGEPVVLVMGTACTLLVAGLIEGFVTGSALPTLARVGIGVGVEVAFLLYVFVCGRAAAARGLTGLLGEEDRGWASGPGTPVVSQSSARPWMAGAHGG